jgi:membrane protein implicated in regulation of membrane protease activity
MLKLILEIVFTVVFAISLVLNIITGSWLLVALDGVCVILGLVNIYLIWRNQKRKETQDVSEDT